MPPSDFLWTLFHVPFPFGALSVHPRALANHRHEGLWVPNPVHSLSHTSNRGFGEPWARSQAQCIPCIGGIPPLSLVSVFVPLCGLWWIQDERSQMIHVVAERRDLRKFHAS